MFSKSDSRRRSSEIMTYTTTTTKPYPTRWGRLSMFMRFDRVLRWLSGPNTTLLLYPGLGPAIKHRRSLVTAYMLAKIFLTCCREYLKRLNLYRQRVWRCRVTGKSNLTYEEALVSESRAAENVQKFPEHLVSPVLHMIQFSTLTLTDLVNELYDRLQKEIFEGLQLHSKKDESLCLCKILKVLDGKNVTRYEVGWLGEDNEVIDTATVKAEDLVHGKPPSRRMLKAFIRGSTSQNAPWMVHESLAKKYSISVMLPKELMDKFIVENGSVIRVWKDDHKTNTMDVQGLKNDRKRKKNENGNVKNLSREEEKSKEVPIRYPIDDLLLSPTLDDSILSKWPSPSSDFSVPMGSVGDLLMVWDFCCSFGKLLRLWPFTLQDFENAINHKESNGILIVEIHSAILQVLIKDEGEYFMTLKRLRRTFKITLTKWVEFLCDFLMMEDKEGLSSHVSAIKRGFYGLLDTDAKLHILKELIMDALTTNAIREQLDDCMEQAQTLAAEKWMEARKKKEQQPKSGNADLLQMSEAQVSNSISDEVPHVDEVHSSKETHIMENGRKKHGLSNLKRGAKKIKVDAGNGNGNTKGKKAEKEISSGVQDQMSEDRMQHIDREMEKFSIRTSSLGKDRNYNRYWFFRREGRLFIESSDSKHWGYYTTKDELDALIGSLNTKGVRERALRKQLEKHYSRISTALQRRSKEVAQNTLLSDNVLRRSTRVQAQPRESSVMAFLKYVNKWKAN